MELLYLFNDLLTGISLFCATLVLIFILLIRLYDKDLVNRISLKICAAISIVDIFRTSSFFIYLYHTSDDLVCKLNAIFLNYIIISHMLLTFSIALNLQLVFIHNLRYKSKWQYYYWFLGFLVPFIITFIMVIIDVFGKDEVANACFYKNVYPVTIYSGLTLYAGFLFWNLLGCLYCFTISLFIIYHLKRKTKQLIQLNQQQNSNHSSDSNFSAHQQSKLIVNQSTISLLIRRICIYCMIPMITQSGCIVGLIYEQIHGEIPHSFFVWDTIATHLSGILNLMGFLFDPAFKNSLLHIRYQLYQKYKNQTLNQSIEKRQSNNAFEIMALKESRCRERIIDKIFAFLLLRGDFKICSNNRNSNHSHNNQVQQILNDIRRDVHINNSNEDINEIEEENSIQPINCNLDKTKEKNQYFNLVKGL